MPSFLHVGCGPKRKSGTTSGFDTPEWTEVRLDIDASVQPDIICTMTDMAPVADASVDAIYSSHNIEHLYQYEVPVALKEFLRVLKPDGFLVLTCPDLQAVAGLIAQDKLTDPAYISPAGPIAPIDIVYGHRKQLAEGKVWMAHRYGFTGESLVATLQACGFGCVILGSRDAPHYDLWVVASKSARSPEDLDKLSEAHFPTQDDEAEGYVSEGNAAWAQGQLEKAAANYRQALALKPDFIGAYNNLASVLWAQGRLDEAEECMRRALTLGADGYALAHNTLGNILQDQGRFAEAVASYRRALEIESDFSDVHSNLGHCLLRQGRWDEALRSCRQAQALNPERADRHYDLGNVYLAMGDADAAIASYRQALAINPKFAEVHNNMGNALSELGRLNEAVASYEFAVQIQPNFYDAHNNLGNALRDQARLDDAIASYRRALAISPDFVEGHRNLANALFAKGKREEAVASLQRALSVFPDHAESHCSLGAVFRSMGKLDEALASFGRALAIKPDFVAAHSGQGSVLQDQGRLDDALVSYQRALALDPDFVEAYNGSGNAYLAKDQINEALACFRSALAIKPDFVRAHNSLGNVALKQGRLDEAVTHYQDALSIQPDFVAAHVNLGHVLNRQGFLDDAAESCRRALALKPDDPDAHNNLGNIYKQQQRLRDAETCFRRALALKSDFVFAHSNLGNVLRDQGRFDEAVASFRRALEIKPDYHEARSNLLFTYNYVPTCNAESALAQARQYGALVAQGGRPYTSWRGDAASGRCLRVGLVSGDLHGRHPVGYFIEGVIEALREKADGQLELFAYSNNDGDDELSGDMKQHFHRWQSIIGLSDDGLAQRIHDDCVDILIDLSGHTGLNRLPVFAMKPAPIQVTWLGYFATTGVAAIDYILADPTTLPVTMESQFTERVWRLPETRLCFTPPDFDVPTGPTPALLNGYVTFGCFNNLTKVNADVVALWARVLHEIPGSHLFLKCKQLEAVCEHQPLVDRFAAHGIAENRLQLEGLSARADYLAAYNRVDITLDPFPFPGGTTSAESLWMGVPVLTMTGDRFIARQGVGLVMNAGLPDWIADTPDDYVARAKRFATAIETLNGLRSGLRQQVLSSPLFDARRFAGNFECALREMWRLWCDQQRRG